MLVPLQVMAAIGAALEPADDDGAFRQVDIVPAEITGLGYPQAVPVNQQADQPISVAISVPFECGEELVDLGLGQVLPDPIDRVALSALRTGRITLLFALPELLRLSPTLLAPR